MEAITAEREQERDQTAFPLAEAESKNAIAESNLEEMRLWALETAKLGKNDDGVTTVAIADRTAKRQAKSA